MKKAFAVLLAAAFAFALFSCELESPPAYLPSIRCGGVPMQSYTVTIHKGDGPADASGEGETVTVPELIVKHMEEIPFTETGNEEIRVENGSDKNVNFKTAFYGVYTKDGEKLECTEDKLADLPSGEYVIAARVDRSMHDGGGVLHDESYYLFSGIKK